MNIFTSTLFICLSLFLSLLSTYSSAWALQKPFPPKIQEVINDLSRDKAWNKDDLETVFRQAKRLPEIIKVIKRPAERLPWHKYKNLFINDRIINNGVKFLRKHESTLERAERQYGVPVEIITAIIGVETRYGENTGTFRIIDSLTTLMLDYPRRSDFFGQELKHFLRLSGEENVNPLTLKGSYAGAMGIPQFIASSYREYAVDFDNDNDRDLIGSVDDAIGSVANYLSRHKWRKDRPIYLELKDFAAKINANPVLKSMLSNDLKPIAIAHKLAKEGVELPPGLLNRDGVSLVELQNKNGVGYRAVFNNFYVITRYNRSINYAMVVAQLGRTIKDKAKIQPL